MCVVVDGPENKEGKLGSVSVAIYYGSAQRRLYVNVEACKNLVSSASHNFYVKVYLLPDPEKKTKLKTKVRKSATSNPVFRELFEYELDPGELRSKDLELTVWSTDSLMRNHLSGSLLWHLASVAVDPEDRKVDWFALKAMTADWQASRDIHPDGAEVFEEPTGTPERERSQSASPRPGSARRVEITPTITMDMSGESSPPSTPRQDKLKLKS
jgi:hypothetical protein